MAEITKIEALEKLDAAEAANRRYSTRLKNLENAQEFQMTNLIRGISTSTADFAGGAFGAWVTADRKIWRTKIPVSTLPAAVALLLDLVGWSSAYITVGTLSRFLAGPIKADFVLWNYKKRMIWQAAKAAQEALAAAAAAAAAAEGG